MWYGKWNLQNESKSHTIGPSRCFFNSSCNCCLAKTPDRFHNLGTIHRAPVVFSFSAWLHRLKPRSGVRIHTATSRERIVIFGLGLRRWPYSYDQIDETRGPQALTVTTLHWLLLEGLIFAYHSPNREQPFIILFSMWMA